MPSYKDSDDYKTYKEGLLQGGKNHRMEDLPPFEFNEAGEVKLAPGELYCRWGGRSSSITCTKTERFSSESNLKNHIKKHKLDGVPAKVKSRKSGANSVEENDDAAEFYDRIHGIAIGARDDSELQTPSKKRKAQTPPPLLAVPTRKRGNQTVVSDSQSIRNPFGTHSESILQQINFAEMRRAAGFPAKGKCTHCTTARNAKCPPALRDQECEVWARFEDDEEDEA
nr:uncharacterized protein CTRU02_07719 [Colletotrichum truncatum]KAF6790813.1 hypothetical protein CTRU02_07719 [Colletotrichum truncatum]